MTAKQKKTLKRIIISLCAFILLLILDKTGILSSYLPWWGILILYLIPYVLIGYDILRKAALNIKNGQIFDENFLMVVATIAGFAIREYSEALAVMIFYQVGEFFQGYAVGKSRQSITQMMSIAPEYANLETESGIEKVDPDEVEIGSTIVIKPGEKIPLDGIVLEGEAFIDTAALTGESVPRRVQKDDEVISGCVNENGTLKVRVTKEYDDSTVAKILELVENASEKKTRVEQFITRFAKYYTPVVTIGAALLAIIPPVILGGGLSEWIRRACIFLIVSCPCALVISVPLGFFGGIGAASKIGVLVKGSNFLETVSQITTVVFDKTGTLTKGEFKVTNVMATDNNESYLIELAAHAEAYSNHPISNAIKERYDGEIQLNKLRDINETAGYGITVIYDDRELLAGNNKLMKSKNIDVIEAAGTGTVVHVAYAGEYRGYIIISDVIKEEAPKAIPAIKRAGVRKTVMLTGDRQEIAQKTADIIGIDEIHAELLPQDKVRLVEELLNNKPENEMLSFVGDGINDAPVLMRSDVGIAMGSLGSDAAIEAADIVIMDDNLEKIAKVVKIGRKTMTIVRQNIVFALVIKALVLLLGALGMASMWEAVFADVGVSVIAILNSMRALKLSE